MHDDNPYSIDRLIEFGMGMAVARQMTQSMNQALTQAHVPGVMNPMQGTVPQHYFVMLDGKPAGPFSDRELSQLIVQGKLTKSTYVWRPGLPKWQPAEEVADVLRLVALCPPPFTPGAGG